MLKTLAKSLLLALLLSGAPVLAAITLVGGDGQDDGQVGTTTDPVNLTLPTHQADDVAYICAGNSIGGSGTSTFNAISGWTSLGTITDTSGSDYHLELWRRVFTSASETNPSVNTAIATQKVAVVIVFRGVDTTTPEDVTTTTGTNNNNLNAANPAISPTANETGIVLCQYIAATGASNRPSAFGVPATPTGLTLAASGSGSYLGANNLEFIAVAHDVDADTTSTYTPGAWTHTATNTNTQESGSYTIAMRPAAAGSNPTPIILQQH